MAGRIHKRLDHHNRMAPPDLEIGRQTFQRLGQHVRRQILAPPGRQHTEPLVVGHITPTREVLLIRPADEPVTRPARQRSRTEPEHRQPLAIAPERDVAHRLTHQTTAEPVMLVEHQIETGTLIRTNRTDRHSIKVKIRHAATSTSNDAATPPPSHLPRSRPVHHDFTKALAYYRTVVSSATFSALDNYMWKLTYKWAKHVHHQNKSRHWIITRYFGMFNPARSDRWVFGDRDS